MDKKPVGKKAEPTQEELEYIYSKITEKLSDREIIEEMKGEPFPMRSSGFIKRRRKEFLVAKRVLKAQLEKEVDPIVIESKKRHFDDMANVAKDILGLLSRLKPIGDGKYEFASLDVDGYTTTFVGNRKDLLEQLHSNIESAEKKHQEMNLFERFLVHLTAETPVFSNPNISELHRYVDANPEELTELLKVLAQRKTFKGKCPVCKDQ